MPAVIYVEDLNRDLLIGDIKQTVDECADQNTAAVNTTYYPRVLHSDRGKVLETEPWKAFEIILLSISEQDDQLLAIGEPISLLLPLDTKDLLEKYIGKLVRILRTDQQRLLIASGNDAIGCSGSGKGGL